jgi:hypothetical protein
VPWTVEKIQQENKRQCTKALCWQQITKIKKMQTASGVKDNVLNLWIEKIFLQAQVICAADPKISHDAMEVKLRAWLAKQPGDKENPLLSVPGGFFLSCLLAMFSLFDQDWILHMIHLLRSCTHSFWVWSSMHGILCTAVGTTLMDVVTPSRSGLHLPTQMALLPPIFVHHTSGSIAITSLASTFDSFLERRHFICMILLISHCLSL